MNPISLRSLSPILLALSLTACASEDDTPDQETPADPFAACKREVIEPDQAFMGPPEGPAVNPQTQQINPPAGAIVATTYLALKPGEQAGQRFGQLVGPVIQDLGARQGLLAITTSTSTSCGTARTVTVWESEAAMMAFVTGEAHLAAIQGTSDVSRGGSVTMTWPHAGGELTWQIAAARLKDHDGPIY